MSLNNSKTAEIIELHKQGKSQNEIAATTGVNKVYVNNIISTFTAIAAQNLAGTTTHTFTSSPVKDENASSSENYYQGKRIKDLEDALDEKKKQLSEASGKLEKLKLEHQALQLAHDTVEAKHEFEKNTLIQQQNFNQNKGLSGTLDKVLNNEKILDKLLLLAEAKLVGGQQMAAAEPAHPMLNDVEHGSKIREMLQVFASFKTADEIEAMYLLLGAFCMQPGLLQKVSNQTIAYLQKLEEDKNKTQTNLPDATIPSNN